MAAFTDAAALRERVAMRLQAVYRTSRLRRTIERENEYRAWREMEAQRRCLLSVVYLALFIFLSAVAVLNLLYGECRRAVC